MHSQLVIKKEYRMNWVQSFTSTLDIAIQLLTVSVLVFAIFLFWRIWLVCNEFSNILGYIRFNQSRIKETLLQIERFCRKYANRDYDE